MVRRHQHKQKEDTKHDGSQPISNITDIIDYDMDALDKAVYDVINKIEKESICQNDMVLTQLCRSSSL
jgi:hypothetical protein